MVSYWEGEGEQPAEARRLRNTSGGRAGRGRQDAPDRRGLPHVPGTQLMIYISTITPPKLVLSLFPLLTPTLPFSASWFDHSEVT